MAFDLMKKNIKNDLTFIEKKKNLHSCFGGVVAQLVRASACHAEGRGFESRLSRHYVTTKFQSDNTFS